MAGKKAFCNSDVSDVCWAGVLDRMLVQCLGRDHVVTTDAWVRSMSRTAVHCRRVGKVPPERRYA